MNSTFLHDFAQKHTRHIFLQNDKKQPSDQKHSSSSKCRKYSRSICMHFWGRKSLFENPFFLMRRSARKHHTIFILTCCMPFSRSEAMKRRVLRSTISVIFSSRSPIALIIVILRHENTARPITFLRRHSGVEVVSCSIARSIRSSISREKKHHHIYMR